MNHEARTHRVKNWIVSIIGMLAICGFYIYTAIRAPYSDNIGVLIVPFSVLLIYGPIISLLFAVAQTFSSSRTEDEQPFSISAAFRRMPKLFLILGIIGLLALIAISFAFGISAAFMFAIFPFWAFEFLF